MLLSSPGYSIDFDVEAVIEFVKGLLPGFSRSEGMVCIGLRRKGELIAGVVYEGFNGKNMMIHVAAKPGRRWLIREYLRICFFYPFVTCGVNRLTGYVNESNADARRFDEHLGFKEEARLKGAAPDGGDVILYVMWKSECRYVS